MNWDAVSAIAEVVGVIGIVVSIGYLAMQIRQSNRVAEDGAFKNTLGLGLAATSQFIDGEHKDIFVKGLVSFDELSGREKLVFDWVLSDWFTVVESALFSNSMDLVSDENTENLAFILRTRFLPYEGVLSWWAGAKGIFPSTMHEWVEQEIGKTDMQSDYYGIKKDSRDH